MSSDPVRIYLAEDNSADVWLVEEALRRHSISFKIENFTTAMSAIEAILRYGEPDVPVPDLILLDYNLPGGHGGEILAAAAANPHLANVPRAIVTSFLQPAEIRSALAAGALCVITKPADLEGFMTEVGGKVKALLDQSFPRTASTASHPNAK